MHSKNGSLKRARGYALGAMLTATYAMAGIAEASDEWQYGFKIYAWLPDVSGDLIFSPPGGGGGISASASDILDALQMTFMGSFEARKGHWSGFTDVLYLDLEGDKSKSVILPDDSDRTLFDADMELVGWVWTLGGSYTVWQDQASHLDILGGARLLSLDVDLKLTGHGLLQRKHKLSASEDLWDGIIGVKGRVGLNDRWFMPYYADVGTGDTDLTWNVQGGIGYSFNWGDITLEYRHLEYDQDDDKLLQDIEFSGGMLGAVFRF